MERQSLWSTFGLNMTVNKLVTCPTMHLRACQSSLDALSNIGEVSVTMIGPDSQVSYLGGYVHFGSWSIASSCGWWSRLDWDRYQCLWPKAIVGILPPFDGPDYGSIVVPDTPDLSTLIPELKQGIPYYVRICASNAMGSVHSSHPTHLLNTVPAPTCTSIGSELLSI